jgi:glucose uptake protein GlcU
MTKNNPWNAIFRGIGGAVSYGITLILIPLLILHYAPIYLPESVNEYFPIEPQMKFWIIAMGMVVCAFAFGRASSPKRSIKRAIFNAFLTFANIFYIYSYWLSGLANIDLSDIAIPIPY